MSSILYVPVSIKNFKSLRDGSQSFIVHFYEKNIHVGQKVVIREFNRETLEYTGEILTKVIMHIQDLHDSYCVLGLGWHDHI